MPRLIWTVLDFTELFISSVIHLAYGALILSLAIFTDIAGFLTGKPEQSSKVVPIVESALEIAANSVKPEIYSLNGQHYEQIKQNGSFLQSSDRIPIVLLHGIFGFGKGKLGGISYFGGAEKKEERVFVPDLGSLTSIHDRARELFYYLKGGTVDYGEEHSHLFGHARFGRTYEAGCYPEWGENHPVHLVGHSSGAQVARVLQQMLADKAFSGHNNTSADWILSITSISGALNGTTRVYMDGIRPEDGRTLKSVCLLQLCRVGVIIYEWLDIPVLKKYYSFGFDHYNLSWHKSGILGLAKTIAGHDGPFAKGDWILPDLSLQATITVNNHLKTHPNTYYISYGTKRTMKVLGKTIPSTIRGFHPILFIRALQMSFWKHPSDAAPPHASYRDEDWHDNDGALNTISMLYPQFPSHHPHCFVEQFKDGQLLKPGIWYYTIIEADHIFFIINRDRAGIQFDVLYDGIFTRCRKHMQRSSEARIG